MCAGLLQPLVSTTSPSLHNSQSKALTQAEINDLLS
jgi:hypothetical protein